MTQFFYDDSTPLEGKAPASHRASRKSMRCTEEYYLDTSPAGTGPDTASPSIAQLQQALIDLLGTTLLPTTTSGARVGGLTRPPPAAHPKFPWLIATDITEVRGRGKPVKLPAMGAMEVPTLAATAEYPAYSVRVDFAQPDYSIALDSAMTASLQDQYWTGADGVANARRYAKNYEYRRYTDWNRVPASEYATYTQGAMTFAPDGSGADNKQFMQMPRLPLPDGVIKFRWYGVPARFILSKNRFLDKYKLRVNQFDWYDAAGGGAMLWPKGSLLYVDYNYSMFTPPVPGMSPFVGPLQTSAKLCDIEFTFAHTSRYSAAASQPAPANQNYIRAGWNLQPWYGDMLFHYPVSGVTGTPPVADVNSRPLFLSFPFDLLFWDPDVAVDAAGTLIGPQAGD